MDVSLFGEVVKSGWGDFPSEDAINEVDEILIKKANVKTNPMKDATPLHLAIYREKQEFVSLLIKHGADVDQPDCFGLTPLHLAAMRGNLDFVKMLSEAGADLSKVDNKGQTPIDVAIKNEHNHVCTFIKEKVSVNIIQV